MNSNNGLSIWNNGLGPRGELGREMGRLFNDHWAAPSYQSLRTEEASWSPVCDVEEADDHYLPTVEMPGIAKDQIRLEVVDNQILISGERRADKKTGTDGAWYSERRFGKFHRGFALPTGVSADQVEASYQDGMLRIYVPKAESSKPRQIKITHEPVSFFSKFLGQSKNEAKREKEDPRSPSDFRKERVAS